MKYKVEFREVIFTEIEVEAENLNEATELVFKARESAGTMINAPETNEFTARIFHNKGEKEINLL